MKYKHEDGTPFTKEEFLQKLKMDKEFNNEFGNKGIDQISELIRQLKEVPDSRRMCVNAWAVHDLPNMVLPPCHYGFQVYTRELSLEEQIKWYCSVYEESFEDAIRYFKVVDLSKPFKTLDGDVINFPTRAISLMWNQRSVDTPLGLPFNIASYAILLELLGNIVNMVPDELIVNLGDTHIYLNQIDGIKEQLKREPFELPTLRINTEFWPTKSGECGVGELTDDVDFLIKEMRIDDFQIENYKSHPSIKIPLSN